MKQKNIKDGFISMLLGTFCASFLGNLLTADDTIREGEDTIRADQFLMPTHPLTNFEIQKYYQKEAKFNGAYSRNNFS